LSSGLTFPKSRLRGTYLFVRRIKTSPWVLWMVSARRVGGEAITRHLTGVTADYACGFNPPELTITDSGKRVENMLSAVDEITAGKGSNFFIFGHRGRTVCSRLSGSVIPRSTRSVVG
jgi:hypothetical protein